MNGGRGLMWLGFLFACGGIYLKNDGERANLVFYRNLKRSYVMVLLVIIFVSLSVTGCATLKNGRGWGQDAIYPVDLKGIPRAALNALLDPQTLIPAAGAIGFAVNGYDKKVSNWATKHNPIFGSEHNASNASDYLLFALQAETLVTALATPSGNTPEDWANSKIKGIAVELGAELMTSGATSLIKDATGRTRPNGGSNSFPSGHASSAFSGATLANRNLDSIPLSEEVRLPLQAGNILLATSVAWARVEGRNHYPSDVLVGAALGNFLSALIHDAFLGLPEEKRFGVVISPLKKGGAVAELYFGF